MRAFTWIQNIIQYIWDGISKLIAPSDNNYPQTGVQPYTGDPCKNPEQYD